MAKVFLSYSRDAASRARGLAADIESMNHDVWYDAELSGGQHWWDEILRQIRGTDFFVIMVDPAMLKSEACLREGRYADALGIPILPVHVGGSISHDLLPDFIGKRQVLDYQRDDKNGALRLSRALHEMPMRGSTPDPMPEPEPMPRSYLYDLKERLGRSERLSDDEQKVLYMDLAEAYREPDKSDDALELMKTLRAREELLASIAEKIDRGLGKGPRPPYTPGPPGADRPPPQRLWIGAIAGGVLLGMVDAAVDPWGTPIEGLIMGAGLGAGLKWLFNQVTRGPSQRQTVK